MSLINVKKEEIQSVVQYINLLKVKFENENVWRIFPILYSFEDEINILADPIDLGILVKIKENIICKFQRQGYEYIISGEIIDISKTSLATLAIKIVNTQKYYNLRENMRFDTNLSCKIQVLENDWKMCTVTNISKSGVMLISKEEMNCDDIVNIELISELGFFIAKTQVVRKSFGDLGIFSYGLKFIHTLDNDRGIIDKIIKMHERKYFGKLNLIREHNNKSDLFFDTKVSIFTNDTEESYDIGESLVKLGIDNFEIVKSFNYYLDFLCELKPKLVIIDSNLINEDIVQLIKSVKENFIGITLFLVLPMEYAEGGEEIKKSIKDIEILYKPLIYNEFEEIAIKYL